MFFPHNLEPMPFAEHKPQGDRNGSRGGEPCFSPGSSSSSSENVDKSLKSLSLGFLIPEMVKNKDIASLTQRTHVRCSIDGIH